MELLKERVARLIYSDSHILRLAEMRHFDVLVLSTNELIKLFLAGHDCVLIVTHHSAFDYEKIVKHSQLIVDTLTRKQE